MEHRDTIDELVRVWSNYFRSLRDWEALTKGIASKQTGCGLIYELPNPIDRPNESFAIADMRQLKTTEPHKDIAIIAEVYFCLQGTGTVTVGDKQYTLKPGVHVVIPPDVVHFTAITKDLVIAVVSTPPFDPAQYVPVEVKNGSS